VNISLDFNLFLSEQKAKKAVLSKTAFVN